MSDSLNLAQVTQAAQTYHAEIFSMALVGMPSAKKMMVYPGIKGEHTFTSSEYGSVVRGWSKTFDPTTDAATFVPRTISVKEGKTDVEIVPAEIRQTYLAFLLDKGFKPHDFPFEKFILMDIAKKVKSEIELEAIAKGVRSVGLPTNAGEYFNGFHKIVADEITATNIVPIVTGVINSSNAVDIVKAMYRQQNVVFRNSPTKMYLSYGVWDLFCDDYEQTVGAVKGDDLNQFFVPGSGKQCEICPLPSWGDSQRIIVTPKENMVLGTDLESDFNTTKIIETHRTLQISMNYTFGAEIKHLPSITTNDQL